MSLYVPGTEIVYESGLDNLIQHVRTNSVVAGCQVVAHAAPDMGVRVGAGSIQGLGLVVAVAQTDLVVAPNASGNARFDLVHVDMTTGVPAIIAGTPAGTPKPPSLPVNSIGLAIIGVAAAAVNIQNSNIGDRRLTAQTRSAFANVGIGDGSAPSPSLYFTADTDTGLERVGVNNFRAVGGGRGIVDFLDQGGGAQDYVGFVNGTGVVYMSPDGVSANIDLAIRSKGASAITFYSGAGARTLATFANVASSVNFWGFNPSTSGGAVLAFAQGSDTNVPIIISSKGTGDVQIRTGTTARLTADFVDAASSVNYFGFTPGAAGNGIIFTANGSDADIGIYYYAKGVASHVFATAGGTHNVIQFADIASAVNYMIVSPAATGNPPLIQVAGSDSNIDVRVVPKGVGVLAFSYTTNALGGGANATLGTIGGSGPTVAAQNSWMKIKVNNTTSVWFPVWV